MLFLHDVTLYSVQKWPTPMVPWEESCKGRSCHLGINEQLPGEAGAAHLCGYLIASPRTLEGKLLTLVNLKNSCGQGHAGEAFVASF